MAPWACSWAFSPVCHAGGGPVVPLPCILAPQMNCSTAQLPICSLFSDFIRAFSCLDAARCCAGRTPMTSGGGRCSVNWFCLPSFTITIAPMHQHVYIVGMLAKAGNASARLRTHMTLVLVACNPIWYNIAPYMLALSLIWHRHVKDVDWSTIHARVSQYKPPDQPKLPKLLTTCSVANPGWMPSAACIMPTSLLFAKPHASRQ